MNLSQSEWASQLEADPNAVVLDVRSEEEWNEGIIPGAITIDIRQGQAFVDAVKALDSTKNFYVYCRSGARSGQACSLLDQMGFENAYNLEGGILNWEGEVVAP